LPHSGARRQRDDATLQSCHLISWNLSAFADSRAQGA
jgi:hypothetical protein